MRTIILSAAVLSVLGCDNRTEPESSWTFSDDLEPVSAKTWAGNFTIYGHEDIDAIDRYTAITGYLAIQCDESLVVSLPRLMSIGGGLSIASSKAAEVYMPRLRTVSGTMFVYNNQILSVLELPRLEAATSTRYDVLSVHNNPLITDLSFPRLTRVAGAVTIGKNELLSYLSGMPNMECSSFYVYKNPMLPTCQAQDIADQLVNVAETYISDNSSSCP